MLRGSILLGNEALVKNMNDTEAERHDPPKKLWGSGLERKVAASPHNSEISRTNICAGTGQVRKLVEFRDCYRAHGGRLCGSARKLSNGSMMEKDPTRLHGNNHRTPEDAFMCKRNSPISRQSHVRLIQHVGNPEAQIHWTT